MLVFMNGHGRNHVFAASSVEPERSLRRHHRRAIAEEPRRSLAALRIAPMLFVRHLVIDFIVWRIGTGG